jgi:AGCS family alanine or glycine:cation symporter
MMMPNLIGVVAMAGLVSKITKNYVDRKLRNKDIEPLLSYDPEIQAQQKAMPDDE